MDRKSRAPSRSGSLPLILLTFLVGIALGWLLRDVFRGPSAPLPTPAPRPTVATAPTRAPTAAGDQPTALPQPTAAAPPSTRFPTATAAPAPTEQPQPAASPSAPPAAPPLVAPTATPAEQTIAGYAGHVIGAGETLATIAERGGSRPDLIARYNLLDGEPQPGRALIVPQLAGQPSSLASAPILVRAGRTEQPWVALTLDAGASADPVPGILKTLRERNVKITFFLTGKWIKENPELTRQIVADGHEIANHTFTHPDMRNLDDTAIRKELADTEALLEQTAGATSRPFFRPPYGAYDERVLRLVEREGYLPIYWTLDSLDSIGEPKTPEFLLDRVTAQLPAEKLRGAIILAHCGSQPTADALPKILDRFAEMGFEVKKVSEVLGS